MTRGGQHGGIVGVVLLGRAVRGIENVAAEALRGLRGRELRPVHGRDDHGVFDALDRVDHRQHRDDTERARVDRRDHAVERGCRGQGPRRVVHQHDLDVGPYARQARLDRRLAGVAAGDDGDEVAAVAGRGERVRERIALAAGRRDDDDLREARLEHPPEGVPQHGVLVDPDERLRRTGAQTGTGSGGHDDDRDSRDGHCNCHATTLSGLDTLTGARYRTLRR